MNRPQQAFTCGRICCHEFKVLAELALINVLLAGMIWSLDIPYEVGFPLLLFVVIRSKFYDRSLIRYGTILPVSLHLTRLVIAVLVFILHFHFIAFLDVKGKPGTSRMSQFGYSHLSLELSYVSSIFSLLAIVIRFWLHCALAGRDFVNQAQISISQHFLNRMGPSGDAPMNLIPRQATRTY